MPMNAGRDQVVDRGIRCTAGEPTSTAMIKMEYAANTNSVFGSAASTATGRQTRPAPVRRLPSHFTAERHWPVQAIGT